MNQGRIENRMVGGDIPPEDVPRHVAYHEAGHAVAAVKLGIGVKRATSRKDIGRLGYVEYANPTMKAYHAILVYYAGTIAEQLGVNTTSLQGRRVDEEKAREVADQIGFPDPARAIPDVLRLLIDNWGGVEAVASALLEHEELDGAQVHSLVENAPDAKPPQKHLDKMLVSEKAPTRSKKRRGRGR